MSILWRVIPPHIYVAIIVASWGLVASLQSIVTSFAGLLVLRTLLGIGEAGFTGIPLYLSFFFKREELALRTGLFISAAPLATSFASSLAWAIIELGQRGPIAPWRLLFLIEGFPSVLVALVAWRHIPDSPSKASFLSKREKKIARLRFRKSKQASHGSDMSKWRVILQTFRDPKNLMTAAMFFFTNMAFASMPVFLPTILEEMGFTSLTSQALAAPPYLVSFVVVILTARHSDRVKNRSFFVIFHALLSALGYSLIVVAGILDWPIGIRYAAIYAANIGFFSAITIIITWNINNQESESKQGTGFAMLQMIGQCGPLIGTRLYPDADAPLYLRGMTTCAIAMVLVAILSVCLRVYLQKENQRRDDADPSCNAEDEETLVPGKRYGVSADHFRFML